MTDLSIKERVIISSILCFVAYFVFWGCNLINLWPSFVLGSFGFQFIDHAICYFIKHRNKNRQ